MFNRNAIAAWIVLSIATIGTLGLFAIEYEQACGGMTYNACGTANAKSLFNR